MMVFRSSPKDGPRPSPLGSPEPLLDASTQCKRTPAAAKQLKVKFTILRVRSGSSPMPHEPAPSFKCVICCAAGYGLFWEVDDPTYSPPAPHIRAPPTMARHTATPPANHAPPPPPTQPGAPAPAPPAPSRPYIDRRTHTHRAPLLGVKSRPHGVSRGGRRGTAPPRRTPEPHWLRFKGGAGRWPTPHSYPYSAASCAALQPAPRSEERRVGKERRSRCSPYH